MTFDLEAARRGEPIEYQEAYGWVEIPFIGVWDAEHVVCKAPWADKPEIVHVSHLRMAKKKEVVRYRLYLGLDLSDTQKPIIFAARGDIKELLYEKRRGFIKWITDWQEYEIGANDEQK